MNETIINTAVVAAFLAFAISIINAIRVTRVKKRCEVDLTNQREDMQVNWDNVKSSFGNDIRNIRKDIGRLNKQNNSTPPQRRQNDKTTVKQEQQTESNNNSDNSKTEQGEQKNQNQRRPNNNRSRNYKPRRKPVNKTEKESVSEKTE